MKSAERGAVLAEGAGKVMEGTAAGRAVSDDGEEDNPVLPEDEAPEGRRPWAAAPCATRDANAAVKASASTR